MVEAMNPKGSVRIKVGVNCYGRRLTEPCQIVCPCQKEIHQLKNTLGPTISHSEGPYRMENYEEKTMSCLMSTVETELFMPKILQHHFPEEQKLVTVLLSYTTRSNLQNHLYAQTVSKRVILKEIHQPNSLHAL